ncbi:MAG: hypothetical protein DHS20C16_37130 [Phycisphaerae bacterium]|nr:MAG: hypothetical protein DHS20C16_37130 [Phycisphaerae bacterium]
MSNPDHAIFEREVRRTASLLWGSSTNETTLNTKQMDGICLTPENGHLIEATVSRGAKNTTENASKLAKKIIELRKADPDREYRGWIITLDDPTADQRKALDAVLKKKSGVRIDLMAFERFRSRLVDASQYLEYRMQAPFGSAEDPRSESSEISIPYINLGLIDARTQETASLPNIIENLKTGDLYSQQFEAQSRTSIVLLGEYGAGKSMTMRELFARLREAYLRRTTYRFPVLLNLREHHGQDDPVEALERHARRLGYDRANDLVRAWRAGHICLLLDGFDELAPAGWARRTIDMASFRAAACALIRAFYSESPNGCPIILSGRASYFDNNTTTLRKDLGTTPGTRFFDLDEFTEEQVSAFLKHLGWKESIPSWLPRRPLLLGFFCRRQLLEEASDISDAHDEATGWNTLTERICVREAKIDPQLNGAMVRSIAERLATLARRETRGLGPLHKRELETAFRDSCGFDPTDKSLQLLSRLFCLGPSRDADGAREFVDPVLTDVLRAGDVANFARGTVDIEVLNPSVWQVPLRALGMSLLVHKLNEYGITTKQITSVSTKCSESLDADPLLAELAISACHSGLGLNESFTIHGCNCPDFDIAEDSGPIGQVTFEECIFEQLAIEHSVDPAIVPSFSECVVDQLIGPTQHSDFPGAKLAPSCSVENFASSSEANAQIRSLPLPIGRRVAVTALRKLFLQRGAGRKQSAFVRGLSDEERLCVSSVLDLIRKHGFASLTKRSGDTVWHPSRSHRARARDCVSRPSQSDDPLLVESDRI